MSEILDVAAVMRRYGLRDRRAVRRLMDEVGAFKVASNLYVRADDLLAHEDALREARKARTHPGPPRRTTRASPGVREPLPRDWWREPADAGTLAPPGP